MFCATLCFSLLGRRIPSPADMCFRCGKRGHWSSSCTKFASTRPSQFEAGYFPRSTAQTAQGTESTLAVNPLHDVYEDIIQVKLSSNTCEFKQPSSNTPVSSLKVKGRLRAHVQFWKDIEASDFIIDTIQEGYRIPSRESPNPDIFSNNSSAFDNWQFVFDSITQLLITDRLNSLIVAYFPSLPSQVANSA